ncbi:rod shape-determining protein MreB [Rhodoferax saidenbachensis]|uniref:Rod shape-determining protein MreB n=1 Tax=Rhodoferax saidenbachensis TaxID=1484693 RepID=A0A1P8KFS9_9BURK|nr:rod shape-determining protein MreB [Rhodoferax saidenbachensis]
MASIFGTALYVQLSPARLTIRNAKTGEVVSEPPELALTRGAKPTIMGVGNLARMCGRTEPVDIINPFAHPRTLIGDFTVGEQVLKAFVTRMKGSSLFAPAPFIVMHPLGDHEGGLTQVEIRALHELALGAGAREVSVWQGRALTDEEVLSRQFPSDGKVLS